MTAYRAIFQMVASGRCGGQTAATLVLPWNGSWTSTRRNWRLWPQASQSSRANSMTAGADGTFRRRTTPRQVLYSSETPASSSSSESSPTATTQTVRSSSARLMAPIDSSWQSATRLPHPNRTDRRQTQSQRQPTAPDAERGKRVRAIRNNTSEPLNPERQSRYATGPPALRCSTPSAMRAMRNVLGPKWERCSACPSRLPSASTPPRSWRNRLPRLTDQPHTSLNRFRRPPARVPAKCWISEFHRPAA